MKCFTFVAGITGWWVFQWPEIFKLRQWNWINFDFFEIGFEVCTFNGKHIEFKFVILGVGFFSEWNDKATRDKWARWAREGTDLKGMLKEMNDDAS